MEGRERDWDTGTGPTHARVMRGPGPGLRSEGPSGDSAGVKRGECRDTLVHAQRPGDAGSCRHFRTQTISTLSKMLQAARTGSCLPSGLASHHHQLTRGPTMQLLSPHHVCISHSSSFCISCPDIRGLADPAGTAPPRAAGS